MKKRTVSPLQICFDFEAYLDQKVPTPGTEVGFIYAKNGKLDDFGEKIGGARKDLWGNTGLTWADAEGMNEREKDKYIEKNYIWPTPDYQEMVNSGTPIELAYAIKRVKDQMMCRPNFPVNATFATREKIRKDYVDYVSKIRDTMMNLDSTEELKSMGTYLLDNGYLTRGHMNFVNITKVGEPFINQRIVTAMGEVGSAFWPTKAVREINRTKFLQDKNRKQANRRPELEIDPLDHIEVSPSYHRGNVFEESFQEEFAARGGEFGVWLPQDERQEHMNYAYDSFMNLSEILGITPKETFFNGKLAIAFGARGTSRALAHYEPFRQVINLTRMKGAGTLGHEWTHAMDDIMGSALGLNGYMSKNVKESAVPESFKSLMETLKTKEYTQEETIEKYEREIRNIHGDVTSTLARNLKDFQPETVRKFSELCNNILALLDQDDQKAMKETQRELELLCRANKIRVPMFGRINRLYKECLEKNKALEAAKKEDPHYVGATDFYRHAMGFDAGYTHGGHGYWASDVELLARATHCYFLDKLTNEGIRDDYLCGLAERGSAIFERELIFAYPRGRERKLIYDAYEQFLPDLRKILREMK